MLQYAKTYDWFFTYFQNFFFYPEDGRDKESCEENPVFLLHSPFKDTPISFDLQRELHIASQKSIGNRGNSAVTESDNQ